MEQPVVGRFKEKESGRVGECLFLPRGFELSEARLTRLFTDQWKLAPPSILLTCDCGSAHPKAFASNLWVNQYLSIFTEPTRALGVEEPLVLVRGVWAGGQRHGAVLWSSDIQSNFETLAAMVPQGVHASMSGIPW